MNGAWEIIPNNKSLFRYLLALLVFVNPSATRKAKIGNDIRPIMLNKSISGKNKKPMWSENIVR